MKNRSSIGYGLGLALSLGFLSVSCGSDGDKFVPGAVELTVNKADATLEWDAVAGADTYNLYFQKVTGCPDVGAVDNPPTVNQNDTLIEGVTSPFDLSNYLVCGTCYWGAVTSVNGVGEGPLSRTKGWGRAPASCP